MKIRRRQVAIKVNSQGEEGNPPGISAPREDDDGHPDLPTQPSGGRFSRQLDFSLSCFQTLVT